MRANKEILIGSLGKKQYNDQTVYLLGQLPGLNKSKSNDGLKTPDAGGKSGDNNAFGIGLTGKSGDNKG